MSSSAFRAAAPRGPRIMRVRRRRYQPHVSRLARNMSRHAAAAVMTFAALQLWALNMALHLGAQGWMPFVALGLLMVVVLPWAHAIDRRWMQWGLTALPSRSLNQRYGRDLFLLWSMALTTPFAWLAAPWIASLI